MNTDPHAKIAVADVGKKYERLLKEGTPAAYILTALLTHAAGIARFGNLCPQNAATAFASLVASKEPRPPDNYRAGEEAGRRKEHPPCLSA